MVSVYNRSQCSHDYRITFESRFSFMCSLLLNDVLLLCCFVLCNVVPVVWLLAVIVWLNSELVSLVGIDVCDVVYMVLYVAWDILHCVIGVVCARWGVDGGFTFLFLSFSAFIPFPHISLTLSFLPLLF